MEQRRTRALEPEDEDGLPDRLRRQRGVPLAELLEAQAIHERAHEALSHQHAAERVELRLLVERCEQPAERLAEGLVAEVLEPARAPRRRDSEASRVVPGPLTACAAASRRPRRAPGSGKRGGWKPPAACQAAPRNRSFATRAAEAGRAPARIQRNTRALRSRRCGIQFGTWDVMRHTIRATSRLRSAVVRSTDAMVAE